MTFYHLKVLLWSVRTSDAENFRVRGIQTNKTRIHCLGIVDDFIIRTYSHRSWWSFDNKHPLEKSVSLQDTLLIKSSFHWVTLLSSLYAYATLEIQFLSEHYHFLNSKKIPGSLSLSLFYGHIWHLFYRIEGGLCDKSQ